MQTLLITYVQICSRLNTFLSFSCWKTLYFRYCTEHLNGFQISIYCFFKSMLSSFCTFARENLSASVLFCPQINVSFRFGSCYSGECRCPARGCQPHNLPCAQMKGSAAVAADLRSVLWFGNQRRVFTFCICLHARG